MKKTALLILSTSLLLSLTACGGPSESEQRACETFDEAHDNVEKAVTFSINNGGEEWMKQAIRDGIVKRVALIQQASEQADGKLASMLYDASRFSRGMAADYSNDDVGTAYYMTAHSIIDKCNELGVKMKSSKTT